MASEDEELLIEAKGTVGRLMAARPESVRAASYSKKWKLPFKAAIIRELLLHRTIEMAEVSIELFERKKVVPAVTMARSVIEGFAVLFSLCRHLEKYLSDDPKNIEELDKSLERLLIGSRNNPDPNMPKAISVLTHIKHLEEAYPGFQSCYDDLSEYLHPNWASVFGTYGTAVKEPAEVKLGATAEGMGYLLTTLSGSLGCFEEYYKEAGTLIRRLNDYLDKLP